MNRRFAAAIAVVILAVTTTVGGHAFSFDLDSIAQMGKFPRFVVNTYRWGDKFFNSYDSAYVEGTGYKFNVKAKSELWKDSYIFSLPNDYRMHMSSEFNMSGGFHVSYLAVTLGYDWNIGKLFDIGTTSRKKLDFAFNCALLTGEFYWTKNDVGTRILSYGPKGHETRCDIPFSGIDTDIFGFDIYYFVNNKRYSRGAAFNYSKIQNKSQGSWFVGFSYWMQNFDFSFAGLPQDILNGLPQNWAENNYQFNMHNNNYAVRFGYAYNWVFKRHWVAGISESPVIGFKHGSVNNGDRHVSPSIYNHTEASVVWTNKRWFAGLIVSAENGLFYDKKQMLINTIVNFEISAGYRFNLW